MSYSTELKQSEREAEKVEIRDIPAQDYLGQRFTSRIETVGRDVGAAMTSLYSRLQATGAQPSGPPFLVASQPAHGEMEIEVGAPCIPVPEPGPGQFRGRLAATKAAVQVHRGPYDEIGPVYTSLTRWASENGRRVAGRPREVYLNGPADVTSPADYLTEVVLPIS